jgi:hypothetical protein
MGIDRYLCIGLVIMLALAGLYVAGSHDSKGQTSNAAYWAPVEKMLGSKAENNPDGTASFDIPRNLTVTLNSIPLAPGLDLSHEIHMQRNGDKTMAVGELVLAQDEIADVTRKLQEAGIDETALHNHLLHETPSLWYMHFHAYGDPVNITIAISDIIGPLGTGPDAGFDGRGMDTARLDQIMRSPGNAGGGVYNFMIPRADNVTMGGMTLSPYMDISTGVSFQPLGDGNALAMGELVLEASEVERVITALSAGGYEVDAVHSHMLTEQPRLFYLHCQATGNAEQLARVMRGALDKTNSLT